jgi:ketosteroid isomerase-like protein
VDTIANYFSMRESQQVEPFEVQVTALAPELVLLTSQEKIEMQLKDGKNFEYKHVFTLIWKKEQDGWKILHSHESWIEE